MTIRIIAELLRIPITQVIRGQQMQMFEEIDAARDAAGLTRKQVYERAGLHKETWRRLAAGAKPNLSTLEKLKERGLSHG